MLPEQLWERVKEYTDAIGACEPGTVASLKRQLNEIAAGDADAAVSREAYEVSLRSDGLKRRVASARKG